MEAIELVDGVKIVDMFVGISSTLEVGDANRYELDALPKEQLSALGTKMYVTVEFSEEVEQGDGVTLQFQFDDYPEIQKFGVDKNATKNKETFDILPPYKSQKIKKPGKHIIKVFVGAKDIDGEELTVEDSITVVGIPYKIVA